MRKVPHLNRQTRNGRWVQATVIGYLVVLGVSSCGSTKSEASAPSQSATPAPSQTQDSGKLERGRCLVIADKIGNVATELAGLGNTTTVDDAISALKDASEHWATQSSIESNPDGAKWLKDMSTQAAKLRVKLDAGDFSDDMLAVAKQLSSLMNENSKFCDE